MVYSYHGSLDSLLQDDPFLHPKPWMQLFLVLSCCDFHPASAKDETKENSERNEDFVFACCAWLQSRKLNESSFLFCYSPASWSEIFLYLCNNSVFSSSNGDRPVFGLQFKTQQSYDWISIEIIIEIDILLFTVSQVNSKFPPHSLLAPLPLQF